MRPYRFRWFHPLAVLVVLAMALSVVNMLRAAPPTSPSAHDIQNAARTVAPPPGTADFRAAGPSPGTIASGYGIVEAVDRETKVAAPVPGRITRVAVAEGQQVVADDVLVLLDRSVEQAAVSAATADVDAADAQLARAVRGSRREDVQATLADAETARARAALSKGIAERTAQVQASGGATADELDRARRQAEADEAAAHAAEARSAAVIAGSRREDIQLARAQAAAARGRLDQAKAVLDRLTVRAPIAGEILQSKYRAGEYAQPGGDALIVMGDTSKLTARVDVDERDVGKVFVGAKVIVRADAYPGKDFTGRVRELGRHMGRKNVRTDDPAQRNDTKILEMVVTLDAPAGLVVGQRVTCYVTRSAPSAQ
jgi:multidrug resistance efflux pump